VGMSFRVQARTALGPWGAARLAAA